MQPRRGSAGHLAQGLVGDVCPSRQFACADQSRLQAQGFELVFWHAAQDLLKAFGHRLGDDQIAEALQHIFNEAPRIQTGLDDAVDRAEQPGAIGFVQRQGDLVEQRRVGVAQQRNRGLVIKAAIAGASDQLVQHREGIADRTAASTDHQRQHAFGYCDAFPFAEHLQVRQQRLGRNQAEWVVVGTRADGANDLFRLGCREDELDVRRWLFNDLQQGVEACRGDHMGLIDDEDLVAVAGRRERCALAQVAGVIDATVAGRVDLDDIQRTWSAIGQVHAAWAGAARNRSRTLFAVQAAGQDAGRGRLAAAARAGEQVRMVDAILLQSRHQGRSNVLLPDDVAKRIGTISAIKRCTHTGSLSVS